jgi:hypothetical protein
MCQYIQVLVHSDPTDAGLNRHIGPLSTFSSSILHFLLIAPLGLQLFQPFDHLAKPRRTSIDREGPIASGFQPLLFYR